MCRVVHCKREPFDVYIGRPSLFGNQFVIGVDGTREEVIEKHMEWLRNQPEDELREVLAWLKGKTLGCWCAPKGCHGDNFVKLIQEMEI